MATAPELFRNITQPNPSFEIVESNELRPLKVAIIDPDSMQRSRIVDMMRLARPLQTNQFANLPKDRAEARWLVDQNYDLLLVSIEDQIDATLAMVELICASSPVSVMVYARRADSATLARAMRSGAREFLDLPLVPEVLRGAIDRTSARLQRFSSELAPAAGQTYIFIGSKGGAGVTTVCTNFAVALAQESKKRTLLIDLALPMGDAALLLGITGPYSTVDALENEDRIDGTFLNELVVRHPSGLWVLPAPAKLRAIFAHESGVDRLMTVAAKEFDNIVVDASDRFDSTRPLLFQRATGIFLVTQVGIPELRNCNRLITGMLGEYKAKVEVVLNRYSERQSELSKEDIAHATTVPVQWRIPGDFRAVQKMQNLAQPIVDDQSAISREIRALMRKSCKIEAAEEQKRGFSFFR